MTVFIEILPLSDDNEISFSDIELFHVGCMPGTMQIHPRNQATNLYSFKCDCGFYIELAETGKAADMILHISIDCQTLEILPTGSFLSNTTNEIVIKPRVILNT
ncbi:hypothetical protein [Methylobacter psychrophilus]|uniref:hypothetical protein n=1 Tax=Methylobacter psychrophilus TaxID=96941 RepID=UPI0021D48B72|nr:hypothetical protein [Methylobacter psychrophilus]